MRYVQHRNVWFTRAQAGYGGQATQATQALYFVSAPPRRIMYWCVSKSVLRQQNVHTCNLRQQLETTGGMQTCPRVRSQTPCTMSAWSVGTNTGRRCCIPTVQQVTGHRTRRMQRCAAKYSHSYSSDAESERFKYCNVHPFPPVPSPTWCPSGGTVACGLGMASARMFHPASCKSRPADTSCPLTVLVVTALQAPPFVVNIALWPLHILVFPDPHPPAFTSDERTHRCAIAQ